MTHIVTKESLFGNLNFNKVTSDSGFKEDAVREEIILPILKSLGYNRDQIERSKTLQHPFLKTGSTRRAVNLIPDYCLKVADNYAWVLDAKSPNQNIRNEDNIAQVFSYANHSEVRSRYFALCNGIEFAVFRTNATNRPVLLFSINEIESYWNSLCEILSPQSFQVGKTFSYEQTAEFVKSKPKFDYENRPLLEEIPVKKRAAKRHYGVHGYFTKQAWNVVSDYIKNFSQPGDLVLDPFGGSGVTAVEAMMNDRRAIHVDINPMSVFMVSSLTQIANVNELTDAFGKIKIAYLKNEPVLKEKIEKALNRYPYPSGFILPKGSDVATIEELFTKKQLAQLAFLKYLINKETEIPVKKILLLAFSSTINKINKTYHNSKVASENAGNSGPMMYYRYRIAPEIIELPLMATFEKKFKNVLAAKKEIDHKINSSTIDNLLVKKDTATNLNWIKDESVDYIYTDPPYGKKIPYLDLSVMWNAWLDLKVSAKDFEFEAIEGGEHQKSKDNYNDLMSKSIQEMYRVLKFDRWLSFVFAHKDPEFWHLIIETAEGCGFEYVGAVAQNNGHISFKKKQNPFTVLSGQLIINFKKVKKPRTILKVNLGMDIALVVEQTIEGIIAKNDGATLEQINDELIIKGLELGFLDLLKKQYTDLTPVLIDKYDYNAATGKYSIKQNSKFQTHIDEKLRVRYYLLSYLRRMQAQNKYSHFDDIVLYIMPLLKNGTTPEKQTILNVLEIIAERVGEDSWKLKKAGQRNLFE